MKIKIQINVICPERTPGLWSSRVQRGGLVQIPSREQYESREYAPRYISRAWAVAPRLYRLFRIGYAP